MKYLKVLFLVSAFCLIITNLFSQEPPENKLKKTIKFSAGFYNNNIFRFDKLEGAENYTNGPAGEMGINFSIPLDSKLWMGFGLYYLKAENSFHSSSIRDEQGILNNKTEIIHLPVNWQYNITDWFGLKAGLSIGIELKDDDNLNQNGLGFTGGAVIHYSPLTWLDAGIEPTLHLTSILPIPEEFYQQHFLLSGVNTYIAFKF